MLGVPTDPGVLWRTMEELIRQAKQSANRRTTFRVECFEIYNEEVRDLLVKGGQEVKGGLKVVDHPVKVRALSPLPQTPLKPLGVSRLVLQRVRNG